MSISQIEQRARMFGCTEKERDQIRDHYNPDDTLRPCLECGVYSCGSVGVAGLYWRSLCQGCKDQHDKVANARVKCMANLAKHLTRAL